MQNDCQLSFSEQLVVTVILTGPVLDLLLSIPCSVNSFQHVHLPGCVNQVQHNMAIWYKGMAKLSCQLSVCYNILYTGVDIVVKISRLF